jgi:crotonobetainyl-CoA:carnitine CoA-transferase CaiB-like acyl-CoA transferase
VISCRDDAQWHALAEVLDLVAPDRFGSAAERVADQEAVDGLVAAAVARRTREELLALLAAARVPSAPVNSSRDIVEDEVLWRRGFWRDIEHPVIGRIPINRSPFRLVDGPAAAVTRPPLLGEDTDAVLAEELGLDRTELERLTAQKVLY